MKRSPWLAPTLLSIIATCAFGANPAIVPLPDAGDSTAWKAYQWNRAKGSVRVSDEYPGGIEVPSGLSGKSLMLEVQFSAGKEAFEFFQILPTTPADVPVDAKEIRFWLKGTDTSHYLELFFLDAEGKAVKTGPKPGRLSFRGWKQLRATLPEDWARPLKFRGLGLHNYGTSEEDELVLYATGFELRLTAEAAAEPPAQAAEEPGLEVESEDLDGMVLGADSVSVTFQPKGVMTNGAFELRYTLTDWSGRTVASDAIALGQRHPTPLTVQLPLDRYGPYFLQAHIDNGQDQPYASATRRFLRPVEVPRLSAEQRAASSIGVNTHHQAHWKSLAAMGIHWARDYCWGWLGFGEKAPWSTNQLNFGPVWGSADRAGVTVLPCMQGAFRTEDGKLFIADEAKISDAYERLSNAFPDVPYWELDNEMDLRFHGGHIGFEEYHQSHLGYIRAAAEGLRRAGHGAQVAPNGDAGIYPERTKRMLTSSVKDDFAMINFHFYTGSVAPELSTQDYNTGARETLGAETFLDMLRGICSLAHDHGKEAWLTEIGWGEKYNYSVGMRNQALYLARVYLLARWCGVDKTFWFFDRDAGGTGRFSTCGLLDGENRARPAAGALATVSKLTALAEYAGMIDLGADRWCMLFRRSDQGWIAATWSVEQEHAVPAPLMGAEAMDLFGNLHQPEKITPEVAYFLLDRLPTGWDTQRRADWLSPLILNASPGESATAQLHLPGAATVSWRGLPQGASAGSPEIKGETVTCVIDCGVNAAMGKHPVEVTATGAGWRKTWRVMLNVVQPVLVASAPYRPGAPAKLTLRPGGAAPLDLTLLAPQGAGKIVPAQLRAIPEGTEATFTATKGSIGPQRIEIRTQGGLTGEHWIRPAFVDVPRVEGLVLDGQLADWPAASRLQEAYFAGAPEQFRPEARLGWSPNGLWIAVRYEVADLRSGRARDFWDWPVMELFVDTSSTPANGWPKTSHQFWFLPVREGNSWRAAPGEWKRGEAIEKTIPDDSRCRTGISIEKGFVTIEALVPVEALGAAPVAGATWRAGLAAQDALPTQSQRRAAWPMRKRDGLLQGALEWADVRFVE
jgi:hypothetical protein